MKNTDLFSSPLSYSLRTNLGKLEQQRTDVAAVIIRSMLPFCLFAGAIGGFLGYQWVKLVLSEFNTSGDFTLLWAGFFGLLVIVLPIVYHFIIRKNRAYQHYLYESLYFRNYKEEVVAKIIAQIDENLTYNASIGIPENVFRKSGFPLFANPATYFSLDSVFGKIGQTNVQFAEVLAEQSLDMHQYADLFRGVFCVADLHKKNNCNTIVYPSAFKYFSKLLVGKYSEEETFRQQNYQHIKLEDPEFERYFKVYGTDQLQSRYLLSPALMARIVDYKRKTRKNVLFSFKDNKVYFGIYYPYGKALFKPPLFRSVYNQKSLKNYISTLEFMLDVIKELNLNSRIN